MVKITETTYNCKICKHISKQISHHQTHLSTQKHIQNKEILKLKLEKIPSEKIVEKFKKDNIDEILDELQNQKIVIEKKESPKPRKKKESPKTFEKKKKTNNKLWSLEENPEENTSNEEIKAKLTSFIKKCHQLLYSKASIVGVKAQNDIMKILTVKILGEWDNLEKENKENFQNIWKRFIKTLSLKYPNVFYDEDKFFNCKDDTILNHIVKETKNFECDENMKDSFSTSYGDIYEYFMSSYGKKSSSGSKELGQFFTPRKLIHLIFHGLNLSQFIQDKDNFSIYDPCMGTGGFLTRLYKLGNIKPENIYGCETEIDTIKFGVLSVYLTTGMISEGIKKCNSLSENPFISNKKFSGIVTNPPFGTSMDYKGLKTRYEETFGVSPVSFEEVYPIKTNNGACLFIQHCVYMLEENGFCAIVLPDGELFEGNSKWSKEFRQWLSEQVNIRTILKVPSGTFEHAGVKTNVVIFTKDGPTQNINFIETTKECDEVKDMFTVSFEELKIAGYSLDIGEYLVEETENYDVSMVSLGDLCILKGSGKTNSKDIDNDGSYPFYRASFDNPSGTHSDYDFDGDKYILIVKSGGSSSKPLSYNYGIGKVFLVEGKVAANIAVFKLEKINDNININYLYRYLLTHQLDIQKLAKYATNNGNIDMVKLMKLKIPLPSLEVQQQIVDELSQIETSIETIELRISQMKLEKDQYKKYGRKAEIRELLKDSEEKKLKELYNINYGNRNPTNKEEEAVYPSISGGSKVSKYTNEWNIPEKTILIARSGSCGSVNMFETKCLMGSYGFFLDKKLETVNTQFNYYYLKEYQSNIENLARGTAVKNLNRDKLYEFKIPLPSQEIQQQCIALFEEKEKFIQSIDDKINTEKEYITHLKNLAKDVISSYC